VAPLQISMAFRSWLHYCTDILSGDQPDFARCLAVSSAGTLYIHFWGLLSPTVLPRAKFTLRPRLVFSYICSVTARHSISGRQPNFVVFSRGRHLYSARRRSSWALACILVLHLFFVSSIIQFASALSAFLLGLISSVLC